MLLPINWLKEYVDINEDVKNICNKVTLTGSHVESITKLGENFENVVLGKILEIYRHENSKKLWITKVDLGNEVVQIVTGAQNLQQFDLVPVAKVGAILADGMKIGETKLVGELSQGMFCSYAELGYSDSVIPKEYKDGVLRIFGDYELGTDIREILGLNETIVEFEITPNRPDCLSTIGMSREVSASFDKKLNYPKSFETEVLNNSKLVEIKSDDCTRYSLAILRNIVVEESNRKIQNYLMNSGVRPINNIVDASNFVMLEMGQPLHIFDYDKIVGKITVRKAKDGETVITLDEVERTLTVDELLICDEEKPIAIAGVMGLKNSEVDSNTKNILIESANFVKSSVKNTSKRLGLKSEASIKYEKGISNGFTIKSLLRVIELIKNDDVIVETVEDLINVKENTKEITLNIDNVKRLLGIDLSIDEIVNYLNLLEISTRVEENIIICDIPFFRLDLEIEEDLIEEVGRLYGFFNIKPNPIKAQNTIGKKSKKRIFEDKLKSIMQNLGTFEITTYSFIGPNIINKTLMNLDNTVSIINPLGEEFSVMRKSLIPNMIEVLSKNLNYKNQNFIAYELGNTFLKEENQKIPSENKKLVIGCYGEYEFYYLKDVVLNLLNAINIKDIEVVKNTNIEYFHRGVCADVLVNGDKIAELGQVSYEVCKNFSIKKNIFVCEIDVEKIFKLHNDKRFYVPLSKYPSIKRDLALLVSKEIYSGEIEKIIKNNSGELLKELSLFDVYEGNQVDAGYKSMGYTLTFQAPDRTLLDDEINEIINKILKELDEKLGIVLRS